MWTGKGSSITCSCCENGGNLDTLTALLREIRETSDIIEAAWLRFTEERIVEGPTPRACRERCWGFPLLVSRLKDKDR